MADGTAKSTLLGRLGKMKVKTFLRLVIALVVLVGLFFGGRYVWRHYISEQTSSADATAPKLSNWTLAAQFPGPLKDTVVQRWVDPDNGAICYIYLPVVVEHGKPLSNGLVHYDQNSIGSISCIPAQ